MASQTTSGLRPSTDRTMSGADPSNRDPNASLIRRSMHAMGDLFSPFSPSALASLPNLNPSNFRRARSTRTDRIPEVNTNGNGNTLSANGNGEQPTVRDYHSISTLPSKVRVPKKVATPIRVEAKVWFANERTWVSYLNLSILLGTLSMALFNASRDSVSRFFGYIYALISMAILIYGYVVYQRRITRIRKRDPGHFDQILGPVLICVALFFAVLSNFIIRVRELQREEIPNDLTFHQ